jgi:hypothetical protein
MCMKEVDCNSIREDLIFFHIASSLIFLGKDPIIMLLMVIKESHTIIRLVMPNYTAI